MKIKDKIMKNKPLLGLIIFSIIIAMINPRFSSVINILNIFRQTSINAVIAVGMTLVILTGGIDLSVGSILALTGASASILLKNNVNSILVLIIVILLGALLGYLNGVVISRLKLQPFIITLVSMTILRGLTLVITDGRPITVGNITGSFEFLGNGYILKIPFPVILMIIIYACMYYILNHTRFGRYIYAIGGNEETTKLSGINTNKIKTLAYVLSGVFATIAGLVITSRLASAQPTAGSGYELDAIAAVVLGGTSLSGGIGSIGGTLIGALIIGVLSNALNLLNVTAYYQMIIKGLVIFIAVIIDIKSNKN
ncbi:ABC transporter permease subunit [Oceanivirga miroungae]|uniref:Inner-membrane translocator n=1 Tax=Oceanivirga miroungae TaxID=1130046 RepID=A0A6I8M8A1_9FUSO|nr:ribose ABC transporter permease [Oceanivirga miroungae]VWL85033.1 inner-membrane translocator [Oceanivirga miroungae]